jgi:hypothetical protein
MRGRAGEEQNQVGEERRKTVTDFCSSLPFSRYTALIYDAEPGTQAHSVLGHHLWTRLIFSQSLAFRSWLG